MQKLFYFHLRRQWVREEDLAKALKLHSKQLRRILRFFEEEKLVTRDHRKEVSFIYVCWSVVEHA
jgi:transcription initiation factor IIE alpha subunit